MGITTEQRLMGMVDEWREMQSNISALQAALVETVKSRKHCLHCPVYAKHPAPFHAECSCAFEARELFRRKRDEQKT